MADPNRELTIELRHDPNARPPRFQATCEGITTGGTTRHVALLTLVEQLDAADREAWIQQTRRQQDTIRRQQEANA